MSDEPPRDATIAEIVDASDGKEPCPECGERFVPGPGMGVHRASKHGALPKRKRGRPRREEHRAPRPPKMGDLEADEIFDTVVGLLFPRGTVPINALTPLLRWRHATDEMLIEVRRHANGSQGPSAQ